MESALHRQLKELYATHPDQLEVRCGNFRIDVRTDNELIEIQHGSLAAVRGKIKQLLRRHRVVLVKPIIVRKTLIRMDRREGSIVSTRTSPKTGSLLDLFHELVYFTGVFPAKNLRLEVPLIDVEEWRYPGHGRRRWKRRHDYVIQEQKLLTVRQIHRLHVAGDLWDMIPDNLPCPFHTGDLATVTGIQRWIAQRIGYCLRHMGAAKMVGKRGNSLLYERCA